MSNVSITKAAKLSGVSRTTLYTDMDSGKVSYDITGKNRRTINVAELERVYGSLNIEGSEKVSSSVKSEQNNLTNEHIPLVELAVLREKVQNYENLQQKQEEAIEFLQSSLEKSQTNSQRLLEDKTNSNSWQKSFKALEQRIANQEKVAKEKAEREEKILRQNKVLKKKLEEEKNKIFFQKLFG
jgi:hypothetical protein